MKNKPSFWTCFQGYRRFQKLPHERRRIVFYSEGKIHWPFLKPFVEALLKTTGETPTYVSSEADDPGLMFAPDRMSGIVIGFGLTMTLWFTGLKAEVLAMTNPDLNLMHVKRSSVYPVRYVHVCHGADSVSMVYREQALDHFDAVFCAGPHQISEIRKREAMKNLPPKRLYEIGYPYQDELIAEAERRRTAPYDGSRPLRVLVAPSWSASGDGTLETCGMELIGALLDAGFQTTLRPHPRTWTLRPKCIGAIIRKYERKSNFKVETSTTESESLLEADILISDWSAIALEYAYSRLQPVLYIDVPRKVLNPNYRELDLEPFEISVRKKIGDVLAPSEVARAPEIIRALCADPGKMTEQIRKIRDENVFHVGASAVAGAKALVELTDRPCSAQGMSQEAS